MYYEDMNTPEELLQFMDAITYGFVDDEGEKYGSWDEESFEKNVVTKWKLSCPKRLMKVGYGHCFDQVELERDWFMKHNYLFQTFYIMFLLDEPNDYTTHTFLVYQKKNNWYLFEHADYYDKGIHVFSSLEEVLQYKMYYHIKINQKYNRVGEEEIKQLRIFSYDDVPYAICFQDFINYILDNGKDVTPTLDIE